MKFVVPFLGLLALAEVHVLTSSTFDDFLRKHPVTLVKFMAPWCGHCKKLAPEYEEAAEELKNVIPLAEVDATQEEKLAEKYNVGGFPTLLLFRNGEPEPYTGGRTKATIVDWVQKMTGEAVEWLESPGRAAALMQTIKEDGEPPLGYVGYFPSKEAPEVALFEKLADANRARGKFYAVVDPKTSEAVIVAQRGSEEPVRHKLEKRDRATAWIMAESFPLFGTVSAENYAQYNARSSNWFWFAGKPEDQEKVAKVIRRVSRNYRTDFNFVWLDTNELQSHAENALGMTEFPGITIVWEGSKFHFPNFNADAVSEKSLTKFIEAVKSGKVTKFLKSEEIPTDTGDSAVQTVVGKQFSEIVFQKDKDVFLKVYAPWCGHCKKLAPIWDTLAEALKDNQHLVIAKMDGTANEPDVEGFDIHGFPALFFVKAGTKTPVAYDGERTLEAFVSFLKTHASKPVEVDTKTLNRDEL